MLPRFTMLVLSLVVLVPTYAPTYAQTSTWAGIVERVEKATVQLAANCTGFVINREKHYVLTANHCGSDDINKAVLVDGKPSKIVHIDIHKDFLVLEVPDLDRPALQRADNDPQIGDEVGSYGYGGGYERPMLRIARVSQNRAIVPDAGPGEWVMLDTAFVGGMSGGAVVNLKGDVVMIVQMASDRVGLGRGIEEISKRLGKYWEREKP